MLTIGGIIPSWRYWKDPLKLQPLWELYYATLLRERVPDASVDLMDLRLPETRSAEFRIPERDIYVHWIMKSADAPEVYGIVRSLRSAFPRSRHLAGGTHVDNRVDECANIFDAVVVGTGEELLLQALAELRGARGERIYRAAKTFPFADYSFARRDFLPASSIVNRDHFAQHGGILGTGAYFSRGCSFKCAFCVYNNPAKFELRTPDQIRAEIDYLKRDYGVEGINLRDEVCIPANRKAAVAQLEAIGEGNIVWRGQTVPLASEEVIALARQSGCVELAIGLESVESDLVLEIANKPSTNVEANRRFIELLKKYGIKVKLCLIFGLPGETEHVLEKTIQFLEDVRPDYVALSGLDPVPGSTFYRDREYYGIKTIGEDLSKHAHLLFRFDDEEEVGLPFEYEETTRWGKSLTHEQIMANTRQLQQYLRERGMVY